MERDGVGMGVAYNEASDKEGYFFFRVKDVSKLSIFNNDFTRTSVKVDVNVEYNIARRSEGYFNIILRIMNADVTHKVTVTK